jgi:predicted double-glycine peptidase
LRILLAERGEHVSEAELVRKTTLDEGGLTPEELAALSRAWGLPARERIVNDAERADLVAHGRYPIVYLYRKFLDGVKNVHAVIPIGFSRQFVTLLDPLRGKRRVSIRKFAQARSIVQQWTVIVDD